MESRPSIAFIGALNVDSLISVSESSNQRIENAITRHFERNGELEISEEQFLAAWLDLKDLAPVQQLSGSSFIAMHTAHALGLDLRLSCVGVEGLTPPPLPRFYSWLAERAIDTELVFPNLGKSAASCIALTYQGQRSLATYPGANVDAGQIFQDNYTLILDRLRQHAHAHITSFFDDVTPHVILRMARELRLAARTNLSLDPGIRWITTRTDFVREFIQEVDTLFLNSSEYAALFDGDERNVAVCFTTDSALKRVVVKRTDSITILTPIKGSETTTFAHQTLPDSAIVDDTGAGDVFAGALIALELAQACSLEQRVRYAVALAKKKLQRMGQDFGDFSTLVAAWRAGSETPE